MSPLRITLNEGIFGVVNIDYVLDSFLKFEDELELLKFPKGQTGEVGELWKISDLPH